jgi:hypothetical protein
MSKNKIEFSEKDRKKIRKMAGYGLRDEDIANIFDVSESVLKVKCSAELKKGRSSAFYEVAKTLYKMATSAKDNASTFFYLKARSHGQFKEVKHIEDNTKSNNPEFDLTKLNKDERRIFKELLKKSSTSDPA